MNHSYVRRYEVLALALSGAIFSGYLSTIKFFTHGCVLSVPCPQFLGQPACYFGFTGFVILSILTLLWAMGLPLRAWVAGLSGLGTLFAAYFTLVELPDLIALFSHFSLLAVPSCIMGFIVYLAVFCIALAEHPARTAA